MWGVVFTACVVIFFASRGRGGILSCSFNAKGVNTKSETSHTVNDISRKVKKNVPGKPMRRMGSQKLFVQALRTTGDVSVLLLRSLGWLSEKIVQNYKCLFLSSTNRLRSIGSQFNNFCLNM